MLSYALLALIPTLGAQQVREFGKPLLLPESGVTSTAVSLADFDGDGDLDVLLSTGRLGPRRCGCTGMKARVCWRLR